MHELVGHYETFAGEIEVRRELGVDEDVQTIGSLSSDPECIYKSQLTYKSTKHWREVSKRCHCTVLFVDEINHVDYLTIRADNGFVVLPALSVAILVPAGFENLFCYIFGCHFVQLIFLIW